MAWIGGIGEMLIFAADDGAVLYAFCKSHNQAIRRKHNEEVSIGTRFHSCRGFHPVVGGRRRRPAQSPRAMLPAGILWHEARREVYVP